MRARGCRIGTGLGPGGGGMVWIGATGSRRSGKGRGAGSEFNDLFFFFSSFFFNLCNNIYIYMPMPGEYVFKTFPLKYDPLDLSFFC